MKKLIFIITIALLSIISASAQDSLYLYKQGEMIAKYNLGKIDSISIAPEGAEIQEQALIVSTLCGTGEGTMTNGPLSEATLFLPFRLTIDNEGALYLIEENTNIRKIDISSNQVSSVYYPDAPYVGRMTAIDFSPEYDILYISRDQMDDTSGSGLGIFTLNKASNFGSPSRYAGTYTTNSMAVNPITGEVFCNRFIGAKVIRVNPDTREDEEMFHVGNKDADEFRLAWSKDGKTLFVASYYNGVIWKVPYNTETKTFTDAPSLYVGAYEKLEIKEGLGTAARLQSPAALTTDKRGNLYIADNRAHCILKINTNGYVSILAGSPGVAGIQDGEAESALFNEPESIVVDSDRNIIYVADRINHRIRKIAVE